MMKHVNYIQFSLIFCLALASVLALPITLEKGELYVTVKQQHKQDERLKVNVNSNIKSKISLTESSKILIQAKLQFSSASFRPQLVSFRLRHNLFQNLTQPVVAIYSNQEDSYTATIDLGDPKQILPYSDLYKLEIIIADDNLSQNVRRFIGQCTVTFRKSLTQIPKSLLHYEKQKMIETSEPPARVDPPKIFTIFVVLLIIALNAIFVFGLNYLKVNVGLFPKSSSGFMTNLLFLVILTANLSILFKFWINWTFIQTLQYLIMLILPTALIANYAFVHIRKE